MKASSQPRQILGGYREFAPPKALKPCVEALWVHSVDGASAPPALVTHRVVPEPAVCLVFNCHRGADGVPRDAFLNFHGPIYSPRSFVFDRQSEKSAIRLRLEWAAKLVGLFPSEHADVIDTLDVVNPSLAARLTPKLLKTRNHRQAFEVLCREIGSIFENLDMPGTAFARARQAVALIDRSQGRPPIARIARQIEVSPRHVNRALTDATGMSPKFYGRLRRFLGITVLADTEANPNWSELAYRFGYADQAHMIHDVQALSGLTPTELHRERRAESEIYNPS